MSDFRFLENKQAQTWVISAPRRAKRTNITTQAPICPFCLGFSVDDEVYRVGGKKGDTNWQIRVNSNKFPFTPSHEVIIHSPDHHKNFDELPFSQVELILQTYRERYRAHEREGNVYIFHNRGRAAGESLPHPHTQLTVIPGAMMAKIPPLKSTGFGFSQSPKLLSRVRSTHPKLPKHVATEQFYLFCPQTAAWPDEVWIAPKVIDKTFGQITGEQITDLAYALTRLIGIFDLRHGHEFPFNFYIYPGKNWYLRLIPRIKILGGFELGTNVMVNTQDPEETLSFIAEHFWRPDNQKIREQHQADYWKRV